MLPWRKIMIAPRTPLDAWAAALIVLAVLLIGGGGVAAQGVVAPEQALRLARAGHPVRVLVSYGSAWFPWYMRRLAERPANLWFVAKQLVG